jgi:hypothetical protein
MEASEQPLLRREKVDATPLFLERICWLAVIPGKSGDSGQGPGSDRRGKIAVISGNPERSEGEILGMSQIRDLG